MEQIYLLNDIDFYSVTVLTENFENALLRHEVLIGWGGERECTHTRRRHSLSSRHSLSFFAPFPFRSL